MFAKYFAKREYFFAIKNIPMHRHIKNPVTINESFNLFWVLSANSPLGLSVSYFY